MYQIMIVDDEINSQDMIYNYIKTNLPLYKVTNICGNGKDALEAFRNCPADILLVDIRMPIMDGLTFIEKLNEITTDMVPIIISSYGEFSYAQTAMRLGVAHYLLKPLDFRELKHALDAASQTLKYKRITYTPHALLDDSQEIYIHDILSGRYTDKETAQQRFSQLTFPFSYNADRGLYIRIEFLNTEKWLYGGDSMVTAITNLINLIYAPDFLLPTFRRLGSCDYLFIYHNSTPDEFTELTQQVQQLLGITIVVQPMFSFSSIEQLRTAAFTAPLMKVPVNQESSPDKLPEDNVLNLTTEDMADSILQTSIKNAIAYMQEHYAEDLTRDVVAEKVYMSGAHFSRCFKMIMGISYKDYLTELRMQKAIQLLKTNAKIADIAQQVGYPTPNRFNINFRHYTSYTPSEYRTYVLKML